MMHWSKVRKGQSYSTLVSYTEKQQITPNVGVADTQVFTSF